MPRPPLKIKLAMPVSLASILMKQLAIRLSPQAGKSLVISRKRERRQTNRYASFTLTPPVHGLFTPLHREYLHAGDLLFRRVGLGDDGLRETQFSGFAQAFLAALHRAHFARQTDFAEHHQLLRQRLVAQA